MHHSTTLRSFTTRARTSDRAEKSVKCVVLKAGHEPVEAMTENLSATGALLITGGQQTMCGFVQIEFADQSPVPAVVKWSEAGRHGCEFVRTLTARRFLQVLRGPEANVATPVRSGVLNRLRNLLA
jgi:hypothetical protein